MVDFAAESQRTSDLRRQQTVTGITANLRRIRDRIRECEARSGREPGSVTLLAVSKGQPVERLAAARREGVAEFGESYLREALEKMRHEPDCQWHFIGPIQSNKTRGIAENFHWAHSVERGKIARRLNDQRPAGLPPLNVCAQVNLSGEASKSGVALADVEALCREIAALPRLRLRGLMAIPAKLEQAGAQRGVFRPLAGEFHRLRRIFPQLDTLSMGMSHDFESAIAEGATMVRLGTLVFGPRM